jgi:hypothetical protein
MPWTISPIAGAIIATMLAVPAAQAQPTLSNLGTLTCTAATATDNPQADVKLSCNFKATSGEARDYEGVATRQGAARFPAGKHVLVWSVMGTPAAGSDKAPELQGMFRGVTGGPGSPELVGGAKGSVRLVPVTGSAQIDAALALTVLSLQLTPMRA